MKKLTRSIHWLLFPLGLCLACTNGDDDDDGATTQMATTQPATTTAGSSSGPGDPTGPTDPTNPNGSTGTSAGSTGSSADGSTGASTGGAGLEIAGEWIEPLGSEDAIEHNIDEERWDQLGPFGNAIFHIDSYDNPGRWVVAQGDSRNEFFPDLYSKFNWTWDGADLYYCTAIFDAATPAEAMAAPDQDPDDLEFGCGGFAWSQLMPAP